MTDPEPHWYRAEVDRLRRETPTVTTLQLRVDGWPGHLAGQHVDVRLSAEDGYTATRSYSLASPAAPAGTRSVELTVQETSDGEVSPFLAHDADAGDQLELRGPIGGWFTWTPAQTEPVQLVAGGSGVVPLMSMLRTHDSLVDPAPMRLLYSTRSPDDVIYRKELDAKMTPGADVAVVYRFTRTAGPGESAQPVKSSGQGRSAQPVRSTGQGQPAGQSSGLARSRNAVPVGRIDEATIRQSTIPASQGPTCYVCGPNGFVETATSLLIEAGHEPRLIRTERFG